MLNALGYEEFQVSHMRHILGDLHGASNLHYVQNDAIDNGSAA